MTAGSEHASVRFDDGPPSVAFASTLSSRLLSDEDKCEGWYRDRDYREFKDRDRSIVQNPTPGMLFKGRVYDGMGGYLWAVFVEGDGRGIEYCFDIGRRQRKADIMRWVIRAQSFDLKSANELIAHVYGTKSARAKAIALALGRRDQRDLD